MNSKEKRAPHGAKRLGAFVACVLLYHMANVAVVSLSYSWVEVDPAFDADPLRGLLHVGILTHPKNHYQITNCLERWGNRFLASSYSGGIHIVTDDVQTNAPHVPTVIFTKAKHHFNATDPTWQWNKKPMVVKRILSAEYFVRNTSAAWYILMTDNAYIFNENVRGMLFELMTQYDPWKQAVILGNCMSQGGSMAFLQGGTGWLMSRRAVEQFLKVSKTWLEKTRMSEDVHFALAMDAINVSVKAATSPYFMGQYLHREDYEMMEHFNFSRLMKCPSPGQILCSKCQSFVAPFNKIVFFHHLSYTRIRVAPHPMRMYPESLHWYMCGEFPHFCKK